MTKGIYRYAQEFGRIGMLEGLFVADSADVQKAMGKSTYLGEALGKHSEVYANITPETVELVTENSEFIELMINNIDFGIGYNPVNSYLENEYLENDE